MLVTTDRGGDPYRNLIESTEKDVLLVAINGQPFYGTTELMQSAAATRAEPIDVGGHQRQVELIYPDVKDADMGWAAVLEDLAQARADPMVRYLKIEKLAKAGKPPPWLMTDKPWDDPSVTGKPVPIAPQLVTIPPLDSLTHDAAYFQSVHANPILNGVLDDLHTYYKN